MMNIRCLDARNGDTTIVQEYRRRIHFSDNVVSEKSRARSIEVFGEALAPAEAVRRICDDVQIRGLAAVLDYTQRIDHVGLSGDALRVPESDLKAAHQNIDRSFLIAIRQVRANIERFQKAILHRDVEVTPEPGILLRHSYRPLHRVGLCIPGGAAAYPSSLLMTAVPAQVAGVEQIVIVVPPTPFGAFHPSILATCWELGITHVYRMGGAQAVAALAYGIEGLPPVDKIAGPGNQFVTLAKKTVFGTVDVDMLAGPSEVVVLADASASAPMVAAELLAQAEHAPGVSILITWHEPLIQDVLSELDRQLRDLQRHEMIREALETYGAILLVRDEDDGCRWSDEFASEHVQLSVSDPVKLAHRLKNAGAIFAGHATPVAAGDYAAGPCHVLPTSGTARWASGLSANAFLRSFSTMQLTTSGLSSLASSIQTLTQQEGLTAHWASVQRRLSRGGSA